MPQRTFLQLFRGTLTSIGLSQTLADVMSYNSLRRFLPTLAGVLDFDMMEAQSVGNWIDIPGSACLTKARASHPMSRRYAADKNMSALLNNTRLWCQYSLQLAQWAQRPRSRCFTPMVSGSLVP